MHSTTLWVFSTNSPVRLGVSPAAASTPTQVFSVRGFEALFPGAGTLGFAVCLAPQFFLPFDLHANMGLPTPPATVLLCVLAAPAAHLRPSYRSE